MELNLYHVVTEKSTQPGQVIIFDENHYNGIYNRIMACKKILDGDHPVDKLSKFINSHLDYWTVRTFNGDAYNIFDGTDDEEVNNKNADYYWTNKPNRFGKEPLVETLIDGRIEVVEIIKDFS
ncbi:hypothetical protein [Oceanobacillus sojae]|uniref:hypothetical protein n=1 Tax=Oceanobacillus sojae TaxID=582851 RepID=UPI0021A5457D|nr:hypothetical protein [Oceanobacillus sojae]MCT1904043.1 hypothetical protein [Oceanobacillus sojae]